MLGLKLIYISISDPNVIHMKLYINKATDVTDYRYQYFNQKGYLL